MDRKRKPVRARERLGEYERKRSPEATNEPYGDDVDPGTGETLVGAFVVHLHDATRRHYDVRIEIGGVLASFAVPRGPSLDPDEKHLAVNTEDHPIEYLDFEDVIPDGQYGAGPMIVWDRGVVLYLEGPAEKEKEAGKLHFELRGMKLRGRWTFVKLAKSVKGNEWLFFKKQDEHARKAKNADVDAAPSGEGPRPIIDAMPCSVLSGLTVDELAHKDTIGARHVAQAKKHGAKALRERAILAPTSSPLVTPHASTPTGEGWVFDPELDGLRVCAIRDDDRVALLLYPTGGGPAEAVESFYPDVVRALRALPATRVVLDGELVAFDASGHPNLALLAHRATRVAKGDILRATTQSPVVLIATDLLVLGDVDVRGVGLEARREILGALLPRVGFVRAAQPLEGELDVVLTACAALGVGGVVAKKKGEPYAASSAWHYASSGLAPRSRAIVDHRAGVRETALRRVTISNRQKIFWPDEGYTKGDLVDYYANVADVLLPYLAARPVILVRYPDGIAGKSFFQWNVPVGMPAWVRTLSLEDESGAERRRGFLVDDAPTLQYIANLACIPLHMLACRMADLTRADFFTLDFDVKQSTLRHAVTLARTLRELLAAIGLVGYPKTSGQSGLHVLVPLGAGHGFDTARGLADVLGRALVDRHPDIATVDRVVGRRGTKVYVDTGQTGPTRAIVAPYSVRAVAGATVSTPLAWDEVTPDLDPRAFTIKTVPARLAKTGDLLAGLLDPKKGPDVAGAVAKLAKLLT